MESWSSEKSAELYGIGRWGGGYFSVHAGGDVAVHPDCETATSINLRELVEEIRSRGLHTPLLIRFSDILSSRIRELVRCFEAANREYSYSGQEIGYSGVDLGAVQLSVAEELQRHHHVLSGGEGGDQLERLKHETHMRGAKLRTLVLC